MQEVLSCPGSWGLGLFRQRLCYRGRQRTDGERSLYAVGEASSFSVNLRARSCTSL